MNPPLPILVIPSFKTELQKAEDETCGPVCVFNILNNFGISVSLSDVLSKLSVTKDDQTYIPQLALCLKRFGLQTKVICNSPFVTPPDWQGLLSSEIAQRLRKRIVAFKKELEETKTPKSGEISFLQNSEFLEKFLDAGGEVTVDQLTSRLIDRYLTDGWILVGGCTNAELWGKLKILRKAEFDEVKGRAEGHNVVMYGYDNTNYLISDPYPTGIPGRQGNYKLPKERLVNSLYWSMQLLAVKK